MEHDAWQADRAAYAAFGAILAALDERNAALALRLAALEAENAKISRALAELESRIGIDLMLARIIIDR